MKLCATCKTVEIPNRQTNCPACKEARKRAYNVRRHQIKKQAAGLRLCVCGCGKLAGRNSKRAKECAEIHNRLAKRERSKKDHKKNHAKLHFARTAKKKKQQTEAQIDARAIAIDKENRLVEKELKERAARLPSHLIAARVMRGVCVSVLY